MDSADEGKKGSEKSGIKKRIPVLGIIAAAAIAGYICHFAINDCRNMANYARHAKDARLLEKKAAGADKDLSYAETLDMLDEMNIPEYKQNITANSPVHICIDGEPLGNSCIILSSGGKSYVLPDDKVKKYLENKLNSLSRKLKY